MVNPANSPDHLNVHLIKILFGDAVHKEGSERGVDKNSVVQLSGSGGDVDRRHSFKLTQWMTFRDEFGDGSLVEGTLS